MTTVATTQHAARVALFNAARACFAADLAVASDQGLDVYFGFPFPIRKWDWVAVTTTDSQIDVGAVGPRRAVDERITLGVSIGSWRPYVPNVSDPSTDAERKAADRAFDLLLRLQLYVRQTDPTLGGTVDWCLPSGAYSDGETAETEAGLGRVTEVAATFVASNRIR